MNGRFAQRAVIWRRPRLEATQTFCLNLPIAAVMCDLYSIAKGQQAIREPVRAMRDNAGNMPPRMSSFR
jgi:hypothetical protein